MKKIINKLFLIFIFNINFIYADTYEIEFVDDDFVIDDEYIEYDSYNQYDNQLNNEDIYVLKKINSIINNNDQQNIQSLSENNSNEEIIRNKRCDTGNFIENACSAITATIPNTPQGVVGKIGLNAAVSFIHNVIDNNLSSDSIKDFAQKEITTSLIDKALDIIPANKINKLSKEGRKFIVNSIYDIYKNINNHELNKNQNINTDYNNFINNNNNKIQEINNILTTKDISYRSDYISDINFNTNDLIKHYDSKIDKIDNNNSYIKNYIWTPIFNIQIVKNQKYYDGIENIKNKYLEKNIICGNNYNKEICGKNLIKNFNEELELHKRDVSPTKYDYKIGFSFGFNVNIN